MENTCPPDLVERTDAFFLQVRDGSCFYFVAKPDERKSHGDAKADCEKDGGTLALPKTESLNDYLFDQISNTYTDMSDEVWIGLNAKEEDGKFLWDDDGSELEWNNFAEGNGPENKGWLTLVEDCVIIDKKDKGAWHDYQCDNNLFAWVTFNRSRKGYICQYTSKNDAQDGITG